MADLSEKEKLQWLGLRSSRDSENSSSEPLKILQDEIGEYETFQDDLDAYDLDGDDEDEDIEDFDDFETYLTDNGFEDDQADRFITQIEVAFDEGSSEDSYQAFEDYAQDEADSWDDLQNAFDNPSGISGESETESGGNAAGILIHDDEAVSKAGVNLPPATVEIYGNRIEFSETDSVLEGEAIMSYSNLDVSNTVPQQYETIEISADVENIGDVSGDAYPQLKIDGDVVASKGPIFLLNGEETTVTFSWMFDELESVEVTIAKLDPDLVSVVPSGLAGVT